MADVYFQGSGKIPMRELFTLAVLAIALGVWLSFPLSFVVRALVVPGSGRVKEQAEKEGEVC